MKELWSKQQNWKWRAQCHSTKNLTNFGTLDIICTKEAAWYIMILDKTSRTTLSFSISNVPVAHLRQRVANKPSPPVVFRLEQHTGRRRCITNLPDFVYSSHSHFCPHSRQIKNILIGHARQLLIHCDAKCHQYKIYVQVLLELWPTIKDKYRHVHFEHTSDHLQFAIYFELIHIKIFYLHVNHLHVHPQRNCADVTTRSTLTWSMKLWKKRLSTL